MSSQKNRSFGALSMSELAVELDVLGDHASAGEVRALVESRSTDDTPATGDEPPSIFDVRDGGCIKGGLTMIEQANPAIGAVTAMATGAIDSVLTANDGRLIHDNVYVGMDFQDGPSGVRLRAGSYIVAQTPTRSLDWSPWKVDSGDIVPAREGSEDEFPYNYLVIRVEKSPQSAES